MNTMLMPHLQSSRTDELDRLRLDYFQPALTYYVSGRFAYLTTLASPVAASLFHVAVERYLKGCLAAVGVSEEKRRRMLHSLKALWKEFRKHAPNPALGAHDDTIRRLDAFHVFRYPENVQEWAKRSPIRPRKGYTIVGGPLVPGSAADFHIDIDEIDALVIDLHRAGSVNPKAMVHDLKPDGLEMLRRYNAHAGEWG